MTEISRPSDRDAPASFERSLAARDLARYHLRFGWWSLLVFLTLGAVLETFHGLKVGWYLSEANATRRLMWTLAHAHGTLLGLLHIAFGATLLWCPDWSRRSQSLASRCLSGASVLIPSGFFLGGIVVYQGDPSLGILLLPVGAILLFVAVYLTARGVTSPESPAPDEPIQN